MPRPIPIDVVPSHVYLSEQDQRTLFGDGCAMTILTDHTQMGQVVYREAVEVRGRHKRHLQFPILGPNWTESHIEVTPTEATYLGLKLDEEAKSGDLSRAAPCRLKGPAGEVKLEHGAIIPKPHLLCSPEEADRLHIVNGENISVDLVREKPQVLEPVVVRVHPTFRLRMEVHQDYARKLWIARSMHAKLRM